MIPAGRPWFQAGESRTLLYNPAQPRHSSLDGTENAAETASGEPMETGLIPYHASRCIRASCVMVFAPHPDDEALGCGGILAAYRAEGTPVHAVIVTSGEFGEHGERGSESREQESRKAGDLLGIAAMSFWREPDRGVQYNERTIAAARDAIRGSGADLVLSPSIYEPHPDHRAVAWIVIEAARRLAAENPSLQVALYEVGAPLHRVDVLVDISPWADAKRAAAECFKSQLALQRYDEQVLALNRYRTYSLAGEVKLAEAFRLLDAASLAHPALLAEPELARQERLSLASTRSQQEKVAVLVRSVDRPTLARSLASVALQTYPNMEVWVLNAGGKVHSPVSDRAGSFPLHFLDPSRPVPRAEAANLLLDAARGDFAVFLDDDDWFAPDHVSRLVDRLRAEPDAAAAFSAVEFGGFVGEQWRVEHLFDSPYDPDRLLFENYIPIHATLFRLALARDAWSCRFDAAFRMFEDWDFWLQLSQRGRFVRAEGVSAYYLRNLADSSGVFGEPQVQQADRQQLFAKWLSRISPERYCRLLDYARALFRDNARIRENAATRERELEAQVTDLRSLAAARDGEIAALRAHSGGLERIIASRDEEIANFHAHVQALYSHPVRLLARRLLNAIRPRRP